MVEDQASKTQPVSPAAGIITQGEEITPEEVRRREEEFQKKLAKEGQKRALSAMRPTSANPPGEPASREE